MEEQARVHRVCHRTEASVLANEAPDVVRAAAVPHVAEIVIFFAKVAHRAGENAARPYVAVRAEMPL